MINQCEMMRKIRFYKNRVVNVQKKVEREVFFKHIGMKHRCVNVMEQLTCYGMINRLMVVVVVVVPTD